MNSDKSLNLSNLHKKILGEKSLKIFYCFCSTLFIFSNIYYKTNYILYMQYFYITQNSTLPTLRMELIEDGRHTFGKFHECIQGAEITFTMVNVDTNVTKVAKNKAYIKLRENDDCTEQYLICYDWKKHDTKEAGTFKGTFEITFDASVKNDSYTYPSGVLNMPIREELYILIRPTK